jgi:hypothetical protein
MMRDILLLTGLTDGGNVTVRVSRTTRRLSMVFHML